MGKPGRRWLHRQDLRPHLRPLLPAATEALLFQALALQPRRDPQFGTPPEAIDLRLEVGRQHGGIDAEQGFIVLEGGASGRCTPQIVSQRVQKPAGALRVVLCKNLDRPPGRGRSQRNGPASRGP